MRAGGYTLIEMLAALAIIGLAFGGLTMGVGVIGNAQSSLVAVLSHDQAVRTAQTEIEHILLRHGAYRAQDAAKFTGATDQFTFDCGGAEPCQVALEDEAKGLAVLVRRQGGVVDRAELGKVGPARFLYQGSKGQSATWPPGGTDRQALKSIVLVRDADDQKPLFVAQAWLEQPLQCDFDVILQDCR